MGSEFFKSEAFYIISFYFSIIYIVALFPSVSVVVSSSNGCGKDNIIMFHILCPAL